MRAEIEQAWTEREEARTGVRGALAAGFVFRALRRACRNLRKAVQAAEDRYLEVYADKLEGFTKAGDMIGWYEHLKGGWRMQGKKVGSAQYIMDEDGKLRRKLEEIRERWRQYISSLLKTTSTAIDRTIIEGLSPKLVGLSLGNPLVVDEKKRALRSMANGKAMGPDKLQAELLKLGLSDSSHEILLDFHGISWLCG